MMLPTRGLRISWAIVITLCAAALCLTIRGAVREHRAAAGAMAQHARVLGLGGQINRLRGRLPDCIQPDSSDGRGLTPNVHRALAAAGLSHAVLTNLAPQGATTIGSPPGKRPGAAARAVRRERVGLALGGLTLPQFGAFLIRWREQSPCWRITTIDLAGQPVDRRRLPAGGSDLPLRVVLSLERLSLADNRGDR